MARRDTRKAIMDATESVARRVGLARVTTKEVAAEAGCSEAALYYHFSDRSHLLAEVVADRIAAVNRTVADLRLNGRHGTRHRLRTLIEAVLEGFTELIGLSSPLLADPDVVGRFRAVLIERSISPHGIQVAIADRLREEQQAGRLRSDVEADTVALLMAGACHQLALEHHLMGVEPGGNGRPVADRIARDLALLLHG